MIATQCMEMKLLVTLVPKEDLIQRGASGVNTDLLPAPEKSRRTFLGMETCSYVVWDLTMTKNNSQQAVHIKLPTQI